MTLAERTVELLRVAGLTCATAESCTGGGIGAAITAVAGSSAVYLGGVISYANAVKAQVLGVKSETLAHFGAVSAETAMQMALGVRKLTGADIAVAVTGIAGPDGGSEDKPVGTVYFGLSTLTGLRAEKQLFAGNRHLVRQRTIEHALGIISVEAMSGALK